MLRDGHTHGISRPNTYLRGGRTHEAISVPALSAALLSAESGIIIPSS